MPQWFAGPLDLQHPYHIVESAYLAFPNANQVTFWRPNREIRASHG